MSILSKILGRKDAEQQQKTGGMEDFMTLIRVYFQAAMAADLGITNLVALPDLRVFKTTLHVPTVNNRLGIGERTRCKKMLKHMYDIDDFFFKEIDSSLRKRCRRLGRPPRPVLAASPVRSPLPPAAARLTIRPLFPLPASARGKGRSTSFPQLLSITPCCIR